MGRSTGGAREAIKKIKNHHVETKPLHGIVIQHRPPNQRKNEASKKTGRKEGEHYARIRSVEEARKKSASDG